MNERYRLNSEAVRAWLDREFRKQSYLQAKLNVSSSLLDKMLGGGHVPKERTLNALAALMGCEADALLIPVQRPKRTA